MMHPLFLSAFVVILLTDPLGYANVAAFSLSMKNKPPEFTSLLQLFYEQMTTSMHRYG
jgi:hypothetical protein